MKLSLELTTPSNPGHIYAGTVLTLSKSKLIAKRPRSSPWYALAIIVASTDYPIIMLLFPVWNFHEHFYSYPMVVGISK